MPAGTFAFLDLNAERFSQLVVNILAVGGAFLVGYFLSGLLTWLADRWLTGGKSPPGLHKAVKNISGVGLAVLAVFILFGHGQGWTMFGGGTDGDGNGTAEEKGDGGGTGPATVTQPTPTETRPTARVPDVPSPTGMQIDRVVVTVLAGEAVRDGRFFQIDDKPEPRTLRELETELKARQQAAGKPVGIVPHYPPNSGPATTGASILASLAQREGYPVIPAGAPK